MEHRIRRLRKEAAVHAVLDDMHCGESADRTVEIHDLGQTVAADREPSGRQPAREVFP